MSYAFVIPGRPVPKGRPRFRVARGRVYAYTPPETRAYEELVAVCGRQAIPRPLEGPVGLSVVAWVRGRAADLTNVLKAVEDGLIGVAYRDDSQVERVEAMLVRGCRRAEERTEVRVWSLAAPSGVPGMKGVA